MATNASITQDLLSWRYIIPGLLAVALWSAIISLRTSVVKVPRVTIGSGVIGEMLVSHTIPAYPQSSIDLKHSGRAVASVEISPLGKISAVKILEAPDVAIGASVEHALRQWRIKPFRDHYTKQPYLGAGRITFYFQINDGQPAVSDPFPN